MRYKRLFCSLVAAFVVCIAWILLFRQELLAAFEALVGDPLWKLMHLRVDGEGLPSNSGGFLSNSARDMMAIAGAGISILTLAIESFRLLRGKETTKRIQAPLGWRLRVVAEFLFSRKTYAAIFEPNLRDVFDEYCEAIVANRPWKARWVRIRGYWSFWSAFFAQLPISAAKMVYKIWKTTR
jgi:hypothetical protein